MKQFKPTFATLSQSQMYLWHELMPVGRSGFVLYGGTALSLRLAHRVSIDFDFFSERSLDKSALLKNVPFLRKSQTIQDEKVFRPATGPEPADQKQFGLGKTTAREMATVMQRFATCDLNAPNSHAQPSAIDSALCDVALNMLKNQSDRNGIPRYLGDLTVANKTGALNDVRNDVGIVYAGNGPVIISAFTYENKDKSWTADNAAQVLMAQIAKTIMNRWQ